MDDAGRFWASSRDEVYRLRETKQVPLERACPGWFAYVTYASTKTPTPELKKASTSLMRVEGWHSRAPIGAAFATKSEAEALVAEMSKALPKERPGVFCFTPNPSQLKPFDAK